MYLFRIFYSFLPLRNPIGFGTSDFLVLAIAILLPTLLIAKAWLMPYLQALAVHTYLCMGALFALPILLRLSLLPQTGVPIPSGADDFSYLLLGDTLRHLRFASAPHPLHQFFETVFILQQPAYASIYPIGQGLVLTLGWAGVVMSGGAFCALTYWMLRGWVSPIWALTGGLLAVMEFGPLCSWMNIYWGGYVSACAGCLVFGALPKSRSKITLGVGLALQILTRPFEALFLLIAVLPQIRFAWRPIVAMVLAAVGITLLQNKAVTNNWITMPYMLSRFDYGVPATFTFQPNAVPHKELTAEQALDFKAQAAIHGPGTDSVAEYFERLAERFGYLRFFVAVPLYLAIAVAVPILRRRRYWWMAGTILLFALGSNFYPYFFPHYLAAIACVFVLFCVLGLQSLSGTVGRYAYLLYAASFVFWFGLYGSGNPDLLALAHYQSWDYINRGDPQGRAAVAQELARSPGQQLVFVRYSPAHQFQEWIHNSADIDSAQTVFANDLGAEENTKLLNYYPARKAWLLEPDVHPPALTPYEEGSGSFQTVH